MINTIVSGGHFDITTLTQGKQQHRRQKPAESGKTTT